MKPLTRSACGSVKWAFALRVVLAATVLALGCHPALGSDDVVVGAFSRAAEGSLPEGWLPQIFKRQKGAKQTGYVVVRDGNTTVVRADSSAAASGLEHEVPVDVRRYPVLRWRWKINDVVAAGDPGRRETDDYVARVYVTFAFDSERAGFGERLRYRAARGLFGRVPFAAISYIWASNTPAGTVIASPHMGDIVKLIVVESGKARAGEWVSEERNVYDDYRRAFGKEPPNVSGVAIMTDTDNTGAQATAFYGDLVFTSHRAGP